ncbi:hypothetical protein SCNRRL3882_3064 [Streptomyces chartreusis NRRL 3882]|uniref:Uncharacterized protein n=1 Tax=Streptomyces chartreusis NRRL 3882 TaxID=1079985 RepID=A0A2N9B8B8_STRCX|nr:hypothetical protein SCNRRL3882_3064 [Streptomyces chartreusis NRRL 3882]
MWPGIGSGGARYPSGRPVPGGCLVCGRVIGAGEGPRGASRGVQQWPRRLTRAVRAGAACFWRGGGPVPGGASCVRRVPVLRLSRSGWVSARGVRGASRRVEAGTWLWCPTSAARAGRLASGRGPGPGRVPCAGRGVLALAGCVRSGRGWDRVVPGAWRAACVRWGAWPSAGGPGGAGVRWNAGGIGPGRSVRMASEAAAVGPGGDEFPRGWHGRRNRGHANRTPTGVRLGRFPPAAAFVLLSRTGGRLFVRVRGGLWGGPHRPGRPGSRMRDSLTAGSIS